MAELKSAINELQKLGFLSGLKEELLEEILNDLGMESNSDLDSGQIYDLMDYYYRSTDEGIKVAFKEGYLAHDWRYGQETDDIVAEFCAAAGKPDWFKLEKNEKNGFLSMRKSSGEPLTIDGNDLSNVAHFFNDALKADGNNKRFYSLETGRDEFAFVFLDEKDYEQLGELELLPFED